MALKLSMSALVIIILGLVMVASGSVLVWKIVEMKSIINEIPMPGTGVMVKAEVTPTESQEGTLFHIKAQYYEEREQQDLRLTIQKDNQKYAIALFDDGNSFDGEAGSGVYAGYFDSKGKGTGKYQIKLGEETLTEFTVHPPGCDIIQGEYDKTQISFVIVPSGYENYDEFKADVQYLINGRNSLLDVEPFKSNKEKFTFFTVNTTRDLECEIGCRDVPTLICCNNKRVMEEASRCDYDTILVLVNSKQHCGSASYYSKVCSKNPYSRLILLHEIGHSFGDLADEYVYSDYFGDYSVGEVKEINCAEPGCEKWDNQSEGCYQGCTYSSLYRPRKSNSIMLDLYPEFNKVCQQHLQELINNRTANKKIQPTPEKSFFFNLKYENRKIVFEKAYLKPISSWQEFRTSDYQLKITGRDGEIFSTPLYVPNKIFPIPPNGTLVYEEDFEFSAAFPYFNEAEEAKVYLNDRLIASTKIGSLTNKCGNGICESSENRISCPIDCEINDGFCETSSCDPDCPSQTNCEKNQLIMTISGGVLILGSLLIIIFLTTWIISLKK